MRFLCDMGVAMRTVEALREMGHDDVHLREEGLQRLPNGDIVRKAKDEGRIVITFDLGFGELVALAGAALPSLVVLRLVNARADNVTEKLRRVIGESGEALEAGAIISVEERRYRVRRLPVKGDESER